MGKFSALEKVQLTEDWSLEERSALAHFLTFLEVPEGNRIFENESESRMLYLIENGRINLTQENTEIELGEGESFGELSIIRGTPKMMIATALTDCSLWVLSHEKWEDMKRAAPIISLKLLEKICQKISKLLSSNFRPHRVLAKANLGPAHSPIGF